MARTPIRPTLRQRIYFSMIALLVVTFVVSGVTAYLNFKSQEDEYNLQRLRRKEQAVQESMRYFVERDDHQLTSDNLVEMFSEKIGELSDIHRLSINLYSLRGELLVSSDTVQLDELGFGRNIDYTVLKQLSTGNTRAEQTRDIDYGTFIMAYWYLTDADQQPMAITNVRYDKQEIDKSELRDFLLRLTQIYVVLFIGASALAFFLSNYITGSLQRIGKRMSDFDLANDSSPVVWEPNDEIGALVDAYNRMLVEVKHAADQLARTERESAWREMAKQVAHEIKNPLTPMKLRVQHLERSLRANDPDFDAKLRTFCASMIEQIQSLAIIAGEFSDFAKMPKARNEPVNLIELVAKGLDLFSDMPSAEIVFEPRCGEKDAWVIADREQILRVLNNLVTNGIQAVPEDRSPKVTVRIERNEHQVCFSVHDNGSGIPESMREQIFVPNFTTKSTGTGLGLAIVRNIVEQFNGRISFETRLGAGSVFTVCLPGIAPAG